MNTTSLGLRRIRDLRACFVLTLTLGVALPMFAEPRINHFVSPQYPPLARQAMIAGKVALRATIGPNGEMTNLVEESSTHPLLTGAAKACLAEWKFQSGAAERIVVLFYYGFSGTRREAGPITTVKADFAGWTIRVFITTDPVPARQILAADC